jgi:arsenate reductase (thioredoxin)
MNLADKANKRFAVLFVCVENSCRSQIAEAFVRMLETGSIEAYSARSRASGIVNSEAIRMMAELGYDMSRHTSKPLSALPDLEFDVVATMGCGDECPFVRAKRHEHWNIPDPKGLPPDQFRKIRDEIGQKVKMLLSELLEGKNKSR